MIAKNFYLTFTASLIFSYSASATTFNQHTYSPNEELQYNFEDTETTTQTTKIGNLSIPSTLTNYQELQISYRLKIQNDLSRNLRFTKAQYREGNPISFNSTSLQSISALYPNFPSDFNYNYLNDGQAVQDVIGVAYKPHMGNQIGKFVYYKAMDIHTMQSVVDSIPATMEPGQTQIIPSIVIPLTEGTFVNGNSILHYQGIEVVDGITCAYFKVVTMGNSYTLNGSNSPLLYTNYQYTFYVPIRGRYQGLIYRGELQETVFINEHPLVIQRQLSQKLIP